MVPYNFRGNYNSSYDYERYDVVLYRPDEDSSRRIFFCLNQNSSSDPQTPNINADTDYWAILNDGSQFPNSVDTFNLQSTITNSDKPKVQRYFELSAMTSRTPELDDELDQLTGEIRNKLLLPQDINKIQEAVQNLQMFLLSEIVGYLKEKQDEWNATLNEFRDRGAYVNSTQYYKWNTVQYMDQTYMAKQDTLGNLPTNSTYWQLIAKKGLQGDSGEKGDDGIDLVFKGAYDPSYIYETNHAVEYLGSVYKCTSQSIGNVPTDENFWELFVSKGASHRLIVRTNSVTLDQTESVVYIQIPEFNASTDTLLVSQNTTVLTRGVHYTLNGNVYIQKTNGTWDEGTRFTFWVFKNAYETVIYSDGTLIEHGSIGNEQLNSDIKIGSLQELETEYKDDIVGAINEVKVNLDETNDNVSSLNQDLEDHINTFASTTQRGHVLLSDSTTSDSSETGATSKAVKSAMDRADAAFTSASNGKNQIATAITGKGVPASGSDTFTQLANKIEQIATEYAKSRVLLDNVNQLPIVNEYWEMGLYHRVGSISMSDTSFSIAIHNDYVPVSTVVSKERIDLNGINSIFIYMNTDSTIMGRAGMISISDNKSTGVNDFIRQWSVEEYTGSMQLMILDVSDINGSHYIKFGYEDPPSSSGSYWRMRINGVYLV
ncbi:tail fiber protein [Halalkalibacter oceani]|uniref:tail fiber protein n=1 Tax=Halalkalibacter oceani TaxID=1653776 RepID=UPI0033996A4F